MNKYTKSCQECGTPLQGRVDKKFCSDICRSAHNNRNAARKDLIERKINSMLRRNRKILKGLFESGLSTCHQGLLRYEGFHFDFYTHMNDGEAGQKTFFCYDYGYQLLGDNRVVIQQAETVLFENEQ